jgi:predicted AlkP superfamily phosphohydrolase/phosphomutase
MSQPLLVLGLDGYDPVLGGQLMVSGDLPNLQRLALASAEVSLEHGDAKRTGLAWEHFATGLSPTDAGRFSAVEFDVNNYQCLQTGTFLAPFTNTLNQRTVVFDAPYFDISRSPNTDGLVGWGAHDPGVSEFSRPRKLSALVREKFGPYPAQRWIYGHTWPNSADTIQSGLDLAEATRTRARVAKWLLTEQCTDWDLALVVVSELHSATEALWHGMDDDHPLASLASAEPARRAMLDVYRAVDDLVGVLLNSLPNAGVLAFNMHGMRENRADVPSMALLPELMYRRTFGSAFMRQPEVDGQRNLVMPPEYEDWSNTMRRSFPKVSPPGSTNGRSVKPSIRQRTRAVIKKLLGPILPPRQLKMNLDWMPASWYAPYWSEMDAFALPAFYDGQIRINLAGREANGQVALEDYETKVHELEQMLQECRDPKSGRRVVRSMIRSHRTNPLELESTEADLVVEWQGVFDSMEHGRHGLIGPIPYRRPGGHTGGHGIAYLSGKGIRPGRIEVRSAFDVVPTILEWINAHSEAPITGESFLGLVRD